MLLERLMGIASLVPELYVSQLTRSLRFYVELLGFAVEYARPEERFASLVLGRARLMLEQTRSLAKPPARPSWRAASSAPPSSARRSGAASISSCACRTSRRSRSACRRRRYPLLLDTYEKSYRVGAETLRVRQLLVADPDGYLLRPSQVLDTSA